MASQVIPTATLCAMLLGGQVGVASTASWLSPAALAPTADGKTVFIACPAANRVLCLDPASRKVFSSIPLPAAPSGLALSPDGATLLATCATPESRVAIVNLAVQNVVSSISVGHTATAPVLSPDGKTLYVCNRFDNDVSVVDLVARNEVRRIPVQRQPVAASLTQDGKFLLVVNHLPAGRADTEAVAAVVSVINLAAGKLVRELVLPNGSTALNDLRVSPDGKYAAVTHLLAQFSAPTSHLYRGWMNGNALTILDLTAAGSAADKIRILGIVLLDEAEKGTANPCGMAWSADGKKLVVTHAGTHEVSILDFPALLAHLGKRPANAFRPRQPGPVSQSDAEAAGSLLLPFGIQQRVALPEGDVGPRAVVVVSNTAYVANYFSDTLSTVDLSGPYPKVGSISLGPKPEMNATRKGELYFHDARICFQGWQSCASCHPGEGRTDGLNWDLLNDGSGNPKNTKSLMLAPQTPPAMSLGVRDSAETAVRSGIRHILFTKQPEEVATAIDEYLKSLKPVASPLLVGGKLSHTALRGEKVFQRAGCAECHPKGLFTDLKRYDVGTRNPRDKATDRFDTPTLVEIWRTAPYLHDGSAASVREVLTIRNPRDQHGRTSNLSREELEELCAYVLSL